MKGKILLIGFLVLAVALSGCLNPCNLNNPEACNKSCESDGGCKFTCGAGCINKDETFDSGPTLISCMMPQGGCKCVDNECAFVAEES